MYGILQENNLPSRNILSFVQSCHKYPEICINMSQIYSTYVQVCQLKPNYTRVKYTRTTYNIVSERAFLLALGVHC